MWYAVAIAFAIICGIIFLLKFIPSLVLLIISVIVAIVAIISQTATLVLLIIWIIKYIKRAPLPEIKQYRTYFVASLGITVVLVFLNNVVLPFLSNLAAGLLK